MVALDLPTVNVGLQQNLEIELRIGADQKGGLTVEQLGAIAQTVAEGFDDQQEQWHIVTSLAPVDSAQNLDRNGAYASSGETGDLEDGYGVVVQDLFGSGSE